MTWPLGAAVADSPSVKHEEEALAAAWLAGLKGPLARALGQGAVAVRVRAVHALLQAHLPQLLHQHLWLCLEKLN